MSTAGAHSDHRVTSPGHVATTRIMQSQHPTHEITCIFIFLEP